MEAIIPVTFMLIFIMAYYGPNAEIIGNVKFTQWHFNAITDLEEYLSKIALYFIVDLSSAMISGAILWTTCKINVFKMIQKIQKDLWYFIAIYDTYSIVTVNNEHEKHHHPISISVYSPENDYFHSMILCSWNLNISYIYHL